MREGFLRAGFVGVLSGHRPAGRDGGGLSDVLQTTRNPVHGLSKYAA